jgi:hypothetical protein
LLSSKKIGFAVENRIYLWKAVENAGGHGQMSSIPRLSVVFKIIQRSKRHRQRDGCNCQRPSALQKLSAIPRDEENYECAYSAAMEI